ncbi:MAG: UDP-N-acetylmuramate dehydrogenase [Bacteroidales bacterium]|nr:UDP-N-acetylmuramate dehydrogenase [Bacteroidales bacterium]
MIYRDKHICNTFGLEAVADLYIEYCSVEELSLDFARAREPFLHVGGGSNLLFASPRFEGTVFHNACNAIEVISQDADSVLVRVGGGVVWDFFVEWCVTRGWYGAENLSLIPGEVGAAAVQNIGAYGAEVKDIIESVETFDIDTGSERVFSREECRYGYRSSFFKTPEGRRFFVIAVVMRLSFKPVFNLSYGTLKQLPQEKLSLKGIREHIVATRQAKLPDPAEIGSAGSFFMNPVVPQTKFEELLAEYPDMPHYPAEGGVKLSAGWMIDRCGLKGIRRGNAGVYEKQALVLVNLGGATAEEILALAQEVIDVVNAKFGVTLHPEAQIVV